MSITIKVSGFTISDIISEKGHGWFCAPPDIIIKRFVMSDWAEKRVKAVIEVEYDETGEMLPVIVIGKKRYSWHDFGRELETYEGWQFIFKLESTPRERIV